MIFGRSKQLTNTVYPVNMNRIGPLFSCIGVFQISALTTQYWLLLLWGTARRPLDAHPARPHPAQDRAGRSLLLLPLAKVACNFKITYLLLYSKLGAKIADSSVSARLLFFHNLFFFWKIYFLPKKFSENFTCRVEQSKFVEKNWNLTFFETIDFPNKIIFWRHIFDFPSSNFREKLKFPGKFWEKSGNFR